MAKISTLKNKLIVTTALAAAFLGYGRRAYATPYCKVGVSPNYFCYGTGTGTYGLGAGPDNAHVQTINGFSIYETGSLVNGITITGDGNLTFLDTNATPSVITGAEGHGLFISADGNYSGSVTVSTNGALTGGWHPGFSFDGIYAYNFGSGGLTIDASGPVIGVGGGIVAYNNSGTTGTIDITTTGSVTGTNYAGIYAKNDSTGSGTITITTGTTAGGAISGTYGISANNDSGGTGTINITANNTVTGTDGDGIWADNTSTSTGTVSITANAAVIATDTGISAYNNSGSDGGITINTQEVTSTGIDGIFAENAGAGSITVSAGGNITGDSYGMHIENAGATSTTIDITTGAGVTVTGGNNDSYARASGISAYNKGTGAITINAGGMVSGYYYGIRAINEGLNANLTISAAGDINAYADSYSSYSGTGKGILAVIDNTLAQGDLTISVAGDVYGYGSGIIAVNDGKGAISITTEKTVTGYAGFGIYASSDDAGGSVTINATGTVTGGDVGIVAAANGSGTGSISITANDVTSGGSGIVVDGGGSGGVTITTNGDVTGFDGNGIITETSSTVKITTNGSVYGSDSGIFGEAGTGGITIKTYDDVTGDGGDGIFVASNGAVSITTDADTLVKGGHRDAIGVETNGGKAITITADGNLEGRAFGIAFNTGTAGSGAVDITTNGTVWAHNNDGIFGEADTSGKVTITTNNSVLADSGDGIDVLNSKGALEINANDAVTGNDGSGIVALTSGSGDLAINTSFDSVVKGSEKGIVASGTGIGTSMTITTLGTVTGLSDIGIWAVNNAAGDLTISIDGAVNGKNAAVRAYSSAGTNDLTITMGAEGSITALEGAGSYGGDGIWAGTASGTGKITITSNVINANADGIYVVAQGNDGVEITANGNITIGGTNSGYHGIDVYNQGNGAMDITTIGDISVTNGGDGMEVDSSGSGATTIITNGKITAKGDGIEVDVGGAVSISAYGDILSTDEDGINAYTNGNGGTSIYAQNVTSTTGDGIWTRNEGNGLLSIFTNGKITGEDRGIYADQTGTGGLLINTTGDVKATSGGEGSIGIGAYNKGTGSGGLTIIANDKVDGAWDGILAYNAAGALAITTWDTVSALGDNGYAINTHNSGNGGIKITAYGNVTGEDAGIWAQDKGTGGITIDTEDAVVANGNNAIIADNQSGGALVITSSNIVSGHKDGIYANNESGGTSLTLTIGAEGVVTAETDDGIDVTNNGSGLLKVTVSDGGSVSGYNNGIKAYNGGNGGMTINAGGDIAAVADGGFGIDATNDGNGNLTITANNVAGGATGDSNGINVSNSGTGDVNITVTGNISSGMVNSDARGIDVSNTGNGNVYITTSSGANVTGFYGINAQNTGTGYMYITNSAGATITGGSKGDGTGVNILTNTKGGYGTLINEADATISGHYGIWVEGAGLAYGGIETAGIIESTGKGGSAIYLNDLTADTPIIITGGQIIGDVFDNNPTSGYSLVTIAKGADFTSEGDFIVSAFNVESGATFTLGDGFTIGSPGAAIDIAGTFIVPTDPIIVGNLNVNTDGLFEIGADTTISEDLQNNGTIDIATGATLEADTMSEGSDGILEFGVTAADDHAQLMIGGEGAPVDLRGQTVTIDVTHDNGLTVNDEILLASGNDTLQGGPGSTPDAVDDNSFLWQFNIVDGTDIDENDANLYLVADKDAMVANIAGNENEANVASTLIDLLGVTDDPDLQNVLDNLNNATTSEEANAILESLLPDTNGAAADSTLTFADNSLNLTSGRVAQVLASNGQTGLAAGSKADLSNNRFWGQLTGQIAQQSARAGTAGYNAKLGAATIGMDKEIGRGLLGMAFSYGKTHIDSKNITKTDTDIDSYQATFYSDYNFANGFYLNGMLGGAISTNATLRHDVNLIPNHDAHGDFNSWQFAARGEAGRGFTTGNFTFTPMALVDWAYYNAQDYTETGAGGDNLIVGTQALNRLDLGLGAKASWNLKGASGARAVPEVHGSYRHEMLGDNFETSSNFVGGGSAFASVGPEPARNKFTAGAQFKYFSVDNVELTAAYDFDLKQGYTSHTGMLRAGYKF